MSSVDAISSTNKGKERRNVYWSENNILSEMQLCIIISNFLEQLHIFVVCESENNV